MPEPWFASTIDGMTPVGSASVDGFGVSTTTRSAGNMFSAANIARSPELPSRDAGNAGFAFVTSIFDPWGVLVLLTGGILSNRIRIVRTGAFNQHAFQYWNGSAWVNIGETFWLANRTAYQCRVSWSGYGTSAGVISARLFLDAGEALVAERSASALDFSSLTGINRIEVSTSVNGQAVSYSAIFVCDDNGDASYVYTNVADAEGADTGGTGGFASVNTTGTHYDTTFISLPTAGLRRSIKNTAARNYNSRTVRAVSVAARLRRGASGPTRAAVYLTIGGTRYFHPNVQLLTTSFESYNFVWETNPATGAAWSTTDAEAATLEWGVEARA